MDRLVEKIGSYNIFNNLLPGIIFYSLVSHFTKLTLITGELIYDAFLIYFYGVLISRFGSLVIEPILKALKLIKPVQFEEYCVASKNNTHLAVLTEVSNTYRSLVAALVLFGITYLFETLFGYSEFTSELVIAIVLIGVITLLIFSFRKQTNYIKCLVKSEKVRKTK